MVLLFPLPKTEFPDGEPETMVSRTQEPPLVSLGHHSLLIRAREKLQAVADSTDLVRALEHYNIAEEDPLVLELIEVFTESKKALFKTGLKMSACVGNEELVGHALLRVGKVKCKSLGGLVSVKNIFSRIKRQAKAPELLVVTGFDNPTTALLSGLLSGAKAMCIRLSDYPLSKSMLALMAYTTSLYDSVSIYRPSITSMYQVRAATYLIATGVGGKTVPEQLVQLGEKYASLTEKQTLYIDLPEGVEETLRDAVLQANQTMIARDITAIGQLYKFVKAKDFQGVMMQKYRERQLKNTETWQEKYLK